jgi:hypothetical protein
MRINFVYCFLVLCLACNPQNKEKATQSAQDSAKKEKADVPEPKKENPYPIEKYLDKPKQDSLLADIITYIYIRPSEATAENRFEGQFRPYYVRQFNLFTWTFYQVKEGYHYFYLIRPARSPKGYKRGVCGKYKLNEKGKIMDFEEICNTPMLPENELYERGKELFEEVVKTGSLGKFADNLAYHEFPGITSKYDKKVYEWVIK